ACATHWGSLRGAQHMFIFLPVLLVAALHAGLVCAARWPLVCRLTVDFG
ncbi:hypothetical protein A2U01_0066727, partial [Trifolium medium]|nr:hypothetical protein [Trifolium medium]